MRFNGKTTKLRHGDTLTLLPDDCSAYFNRPSEQYCVKSRPFLERVSPVNRKVTTPHFHLETHGLSKDKQQEIFGNIGQMIADLHNMNMSSVDVDSAGALHVTFWSKRRKKVQY